MAETKLANGFSGVQSVIASAVLIAVLGLASRFLGLLRDRALASAFGAGSVLDAYHAAFRIPDFLFNLLGLGALSAAFLPIYLRLRSGDAHRASRFASIILSDLAIVLAGLCVVGAIAAPPLVRVLAPGFTPDQLALTASFARVMFLASFLLGLSTVAGGVLQAESRFLAFAAAPLVYNLGIIAGIFLLVPLLGPIGIAWGVVLGAALHAIVQWIAAARAGFHARWVPRANDPDVRATARLLLPRILGLASSHVQLIAITAIASTLASGTIAVFTFANNIQMVPISLIGIAYAVAVFPRLTAAVHDADRGIFRAQFSTAVRQIALLAFPAMVLLLTLKAQAVRALLGAGVFDWDDTVRTLYALEAFGFGLIAAMLVPLLTRSFYAFEDTRTPFAIGIIADVVAIVAAWWLGRTLGARGLAAAVSIAATVQAATLLACLRMRTGALDGRRIVLAIMKFGVASFVMAMVIQVVKPIVAAMTGTDTFLGIALQGVIAGAVGCIVYLVVGIVLRSDEIIALAAVLRKHAIRMARPSIEGAEEVQGR